MGNNIKVSTPYGQVVMGVRKTQRERGRKHSVYSDRGNLSANGWPAILWVAENSPNDVRRSLFSALSRMYTERSPEEVWGTPLPTPTRLNGHSMNEVLAAKAYKLLWGLAQAGQLQNDSPAQSSGAQAIFQRDGSIKIPTPRGDVLLGVRTRRPGHDVYSDTGNFSAKSWHAVEYVVDNSPRDVLVALNSALQRYLGADATRITGYSGDVYRKLVAKLAATGFVVPRFNMPGKAPLLSRSVLTFDITSLPGATEYLTDEELAAQEEEDEAAWPGPLVTPPPDEEFTDATADATSDDVVDDVVDDTADDVYPEYPPVFSTPPELPPAKAPGMGVFAAVAALGLGFLLFRE